MVNIWAHRGASTLAPENSLEAFQLAFEHGADGLEIDVQRTRDDVLVVCHDETVDRISDGHGAIVDLSYDELAQLDFSAGMAGFGRVRIPRLDEVLELICGTDKILNIELKNSIEPYPGMEKQVEARVKAHSLSAQVWYSSFNHPSLLELADSLSPRGVLFDLALVKPWIYAAGFGAEALHPHHRYVNADMVAQAHQLGIRVHPWTVDDPDAMAQLVAIGVDALITNRPDIAQTVLARS